MFQVASSVKPSLRSNIPKPNSIPRNGRFLDTQITYIIGGICVSFCHWATATVFRARESVVSKWVRRSEWNLAFKRHFFACCGIALKHSMDTTRHVFCSRSIGISLERVCFRLHPESSLCYIQNIPEPKDIPRNQRFQIRRMALFCEFLRFFQRSLANRVMWNKRESMRDTLPPLTVGDAGEHGVIKCSQNVQVLSCISKS